MVKAADLELEFNQYKGDSTARLTTLENELAAMRLEANQRHEQSNQRHEQSTKFQEEMMRMMYEIGESVLREKSHFWLLRLKSSKLKCKPLASSHTRNTL